MPNFKIHCHPGIQDKLHCIPYLMMAWQLFDHDHKATLLWQAFKERLANTQNVSMQFEFPATTTNDLSHLEEPFTTKEIDEIINCMPNDKSPGPDGFNGIFMKKCWDKIKEQVYKFCFDFQNENVDLAPINFAFITLISKKDSPESPNDFRPISLVSMPIKILTKILANRVQKDICSILSKNQYGFIKNKTIQDCLALCLSIFTTNLGEKLSSSRLTLKKLLTKWNIVPSSIC